VKTQLLCTFTTKDELGYALQRIRDTYHIVYNYIYVLQNKSNLDELFITYNIDTSQPPTTQLENTISMHRKKQTNTLYTINALNELIKEENGGILDTTFIVDWERVKNCIILTNVEGTKRIGTRVFDIITFDEN
jgi:hypothetical protein